MKGVLAVIACLCVLCAPRAANADYVGSVLGCSGNPCVVKYNPGGEVKRFEAAARQIKRTGRRIVIDGPCGSACAILADRARGNVCVTSNAMFGFHKSALVQQYGYGGPVKVVRRFDPKHSRDIAGWVKRHGGYPSKGFRVMSARDARRIWKPC